MVDKVVVYSYVDVVLGKKPAPRAAKLTGEICT